MVNKSNYFKVGVFAAATIALFVAVTLFLSKSEALFSSKATLLAEFENTSGLVVGSPVRLAGINIGTVEDIRFSEDPQKKKVIVVLGVDDDYLERIREDSIAQLNTKGLLGDMMINISLGSPNAKPLEDGGQLRSKEIEGLAQVIASVEGAVSTVKNLTAVVDERLRMVLTEDLAKDIGRIAKSTANVMHQVENGNGLAHALLYDPKISEAAAGLLADGRKTAARIENTAGRIERAVAEVENGDGILHGAIYGNGGSKVFEELASASSELKAILKEVREGNGIAHTLIYEEDRTNLLVNLSRAAEIVEKLAVEVDEGKGTIGGLLKDPTVYRDLKNVLGDIRRNILLKALVRMTIKEDHIERPTVAEAPPETPDPSSD